MTPITLRLPSDHNQLYQVAISQSHSAPVRRAYPRRALIPPPAVDELLRIPLPRTPVNRDKRGPRLLDPGSANYHCILLQAMDDAYPAPYAPSLHPAIGLAWSG